MAIGLGKMFGFEFEENFNYPYIAKSITDFWRRWHISLSSWFRDYVYIPLGGNRVSLIKQYRNILIVWMLTGLWHGAAWNFVMWGLYYALLLMFEKSVGYGKKWSLPAAAAGSRWNPADTASTAAYAPGAARRTGTPPSAPRRSRCPPPRRRSARCCRR